MIRFFAYVRKSLDRSDRQIMSIEGQINEIKRFAKQNGYVIVDIIIETKSAKKPGRPQFNDMIERLQKGEANGILCWKLNRLARNPVDAGTISWMLQGNVIKAIHSKERSYLPTDNVLMMQIDFGIANQYVKDLSSDVKRGMRDKAREGWCPQGRLPMGYIHSAEKKDSKVKVMHDPESFDLVKDLWKLMETGVYSVNDIKKRADSLGLVNKKGEKYALGTFYTMFRNPIYYGKFFWPDEQGKHILWNGKHKPMISEVTYRRVQKIIALRNRNNRPQGYFFPYRGLITCGECGGSVSAERKLQVTCQGCRYKYSIRTNEICPKCSKKLSEMKHPNIIDITYYRCTRKKDNSCRQKAITESKIEELITHELGKVSIPQEIYDLLKVHLPDHLEQKIENESLRTKSINRKITRLKSKLKNLLDLRVSGEIDRDQAKSLSSEYQAEIDQLETELFERNHAQEIIRSEALMYLEFAKNCIERFENGDNTTKKELASFFGSNFTLKDKTLYFSTKSAPDILKLMTYTLLGNSVRSNWIFPSNIKEYKEI